MPPRYGMCVGVRVLLAHDIHFPGSANPLHGTLRRDCVAGQRPSVLLPVGDNVSGGIEPVNMRSLGIVGRSGTGQRGSHFGP